MKYEALILRIADAQNLTNPAHRITRFYEMNHNTNQILSAMLDGDEEKIKIAIGKSLVSMTVMAAASNTTIDECLDLAWKEIDKNGK